ncbi:MAG: hypothetical protein GY830_08270 [Bacteroidetes bacterium]|nr:hypothetical protein [Bacteroidota bacterium]
MLPKLISQNIDMFKFKSYNKFIFIILFSCNLKSNLSMKRIIHSNGKKSQYLYHKCEWKHVEYTGIKYLNLSDTQLEEEQKNALAFDKIISHYLKEYKVNIKVIYELLLHHSCYPQLLNIQILNNKYFQKGKIILFESEDEYEPLTFTPILKLNSVIMTMPKSLYKIKKSEQRYCLNTYKEKKDKKKDETINQYNLNFIPPQFFDKTKCINHNLVYKYVKSTFPLKNKSYVITCSDKIKLLYHDFSYSSFTYDWGKPGYPIYVLGEEESHSLENELLYFTIKHNSGEYRDIIRVLYHINDDEDIILLNTSEWDKKGNDKDIKFEEIYFLHTFEFKNNKNQ